MPSWSWQWMTYSECCLLIFYKSPKKWFIYILWQSRRSAVLWFPSLQKYNLSPIYLAMSQCPTFPTHSAHAPTYTYRHHNTHILKPNQLSPNCFLQFGNKFAKNVITIFVSYFHVMCSLLQCPGSQIVVRADFNESNQEIRGLTDTW